MPEFRFLPEQASSIAGEIDALYFFLIGVSTFFTVLIAGLIVYFSIKYRRGSRANRANPPHSSLTLELIWIVVPLGISLVIFGWGAKLFFETARPPANAIEVTVNAKQWMWKFQHPQGRREVDELHVPLNRPVKLKMISQDVIHSMFVPAFRVKQDVLPGRYSYVWFQATKPGEYHLFCAEYCGTDHSRMRGRVVVMQPQAYQSWLAGSVSNEPPAVAGARLFEQMRCNSCHRGDGEQSRGPPLERMLTRPVQLVGGESIVADDDYIRESILKPNAKVVAGYSAPGGVSIMPTFEGQISEEGLLAITAYIKSLGDESLRDEGGTKP